MTSGNGVVYDADELDGSYGITGSCDVEKCDSIFFINGFENVKRNCNVR